MSILAYFLHDFEKHTLTTLKISMKILSGSNQLNSNWTSSQLSLWFSRPQNLPFLLRLCISLSPFSPLTFFPLSFVAWKVVELDIWPSPSMGWKTWKGNINSHVLSGIKGVFITNGFWAAPMVAAQPSQWNNQPPTDPKTKRRHLSYWRKINQLEKWAIKL